MADTRGTAKVMAYHGMTYSHHGLCDPAMMPDYVSKITQAHASSMWARVDPDLPSWDDVRYFLRAVKWDVGHEMQACARPDGSERTLANNRDTCKWEPRPNPDKGQSSSAKQTKSNVKLKRGPGAVPDEPSQRRAFLSNPRPSRALLLMRQRMWTLNRRRIRMLQLTRSLSLKRRPLIQPLRPKEASLRGTVLPHFPTADSTHENSKNSMPDHVCHGPLLVSEGPIGCENGRNVLETNYHVHLQCIPPSIFVAFPLCWQYLSEQTIFRVQVCTETIVPRCTCDKHFTPPQLLHRYFPENHLCNETETTSQNFSL